MAGANTKELKRRIKSIKNTLQVTKALELISSVKMRKAIESTLHSRDFSIQIWQLIAQLYPRDTEGEPLPEIFQDNSADKELLIIIAADKGLAGSYNANVLRLARQKVQHDTEKQFDVIAVGKRATKVAKFSSNVNIISEYTHTDEEYDFFQTSPITKQVLDSFNRKEYNKVSLIFTDFVNTLKQEAMCKQILPVEKKPISDNDTADNNIISDFIYEPNKSELLNTLGRLAVRSQIYQALLEADASEHAARMVAMKNATENGNQLVTDLTFTFNQLRQQAITQEIAEISAGRAALQTT